MKQRDKMAAKVAERDERIAEARRGAEDDRVDVSAVGEELIALYSDPDRVAQACPRRRHGRGRGERVQPQRATVCGYVRAGAAD